MLIDKIDKVLENKESKERVHHYPTDASRCSRALWYDWHKITPSDPFSLTSLWKMAMGDAIHDRTAKLLEEAGFNVEEEVEFKADLGEDFEHKLSGRIDNVITTENSEKVGVELKSSFGRGIVEIQKKQEPKEDHLWQVGMYLTYTDIKKFILFYIGRDNAYRTEFEVSLTNPDTLKCNNREFKFPINDILRKFKQAQGEVLPERPYKVAIKNGEIVQKYQKDKVEYKSDWQCMYCKYLHHCWKGVSE